MEPAVTVRSHPGKEYIAAGGDPLGQGLVFFDHCFLTHDHSGEALGEVGQRRIGSGGTLQGVLFAPGPFEFLGEEPGSLLDLSKQLLFGAVAAVGPAAASHEREQEHAPNDVHRTMSRYVHSNYEYVLWLGPCVGTSTQRWHRSSVNCHRSSVS